jgi:hypothetical protein
MTLERRRVSRGPAAEFKPRYVREHRFRRPFYWLRGR